MRQCLWCSQPFSRNFSREAIMNTNSFAAASVIVSLILCVTCCDLGCKKDDSGPTGPSGPQYGSGTVTAASSAGSFSISGTGVHPMRAGPSVVAVYDTAVHVFLLEAYERVSGSNYNFFEFNAHMTAGVDTGTYIHPATFCDFHVMFNGDTANAEAEAYHRVSGTFTVSSVSGANVSGTYSFLAGRGTDQPIQFTGTFNVTYVVREIFTASARSVSVQPSWFSAR